MYNKKMNKIKAAPRIQKDEFFRLIAINSGVGDLDTVRDVFYGMVKTISKELRSKNRVKLPDWGEFYIKVQKPKKTWDVERKIMKTISERPMVKFNPDYKVKAYFYGLGK